MSTPNPLDQQSPLDMIRQSENPVTALSQKQGQFTSETAQQIENHPVPQPNRGIMEIAPILIGLAAIGGHATGLHAQAMLGAINGMTSGMMKGDQAAFEQHLQQFKLNQERLLAVYKLRNQYYEEMMHAYQGQAMAQLKAIQMSAMLANDQFNKKFKLATIQLDQQKLHAQQQALMSKLQIALKNLDLNKLKVQLQMMKGQAAKAAAAKQANSNAMTDDAVTMAAIQYILTHKLPYLGMMKSGGRIQVLNKAASILRELHLSPWQMASREQLFEGASRAVHKLQETGAMLDTWESSAKDMAKVLLQDSANVPRTNWTLINKAILAGETEVASNPQATQLLNEVISFSNEYSRVMNGGQASTNMVKDEATKITNAAMAHGTLGGVISQELKNMDIRKKAFQAGIMRKMSMMESIMQGPQPEAGASERITPGKPPPGAKILKRGTTSDGKAVAKYSDGNVYYVPAQ